MVKIELLSALAAKNLKIIFDIPEKHTFALKSIFFLSLLQNSFFAKASLIGALDELFPRTSS
jgi:hypothetical protein